MYGIFSSDWSGGTWFQDYTSNFNDSGFYIGACQQQCNQTMNHVWSQYNALGYSGTNSGGQLVVENSQFDHNEDGFDINSQNNSGGPSPQDGTCPNGAVSPITHTHSCWVFMGNYVHDNNNPNVPSSGAAAAGTVGTGISISGGRDDTVMNNRFVNNGAWGVILVPYPDTEAPPANATPCSGGVSSPGNTCLYDDWGNALIGNTFTHNGFFGNETQPNDCSKTTILAGTNPSVTSQVLCDSEFLGPSQTPCPPGANYPRRQTVVMHGLPAGLATMPRPCAGVRANPWCPARRRHRKRHHHTPTHHAGTPPY
jgi:hypothetical protein